MIVVDEQMKALLRRTERLNALAEEDEIYLFWKTLWQKNAADFERFANLMPKKIRNMLWGYADGGRIMMQRMNTIACEQMEFTEKQPVAKKESDSILAFKPKK